MISPTPSIQTYGLSKRYAGATTYALKGLDLKIAPGEVYGFLGPNGAGKSTTIRLLMNFIQPTKGSAEIEGRDVVEESVTIKTQVGYLSGEIALYPKMTGREFLDYMSQLQPPKRGNYRQELIRTFRLNLNQKIDQLSKGNRQKLGIIQAFMHEPDVLILDEPTSGLDPLMQEAFFELVRTAKKGGTTFFISSHNLNEVQKICDRVGFIKSGRLIADQSINDLTKNAAQTYDIAFVDNVPLAQLKRLPRSKVAANSPRHATIQMRGDLAPLFTLLSKYKVHSLDRREVNLEEEFLSFYKGTKK